ncbi:hypothetical protein ACHAWF_006058 [Thalassiosira exigua]
MPRLRSQASLAGTSVGVCARTLKDDYTPRTRDGPFDTHRALFRSRYNTALASPILVHGKKCAGAILLPLRQEDAFDRSDRVLVSDIGLLLGSHIYAKRSLKSAEEARMRSREMLRSFVPPKVLDKIEHYWHENRSSDRKAHHKRSDSRSLSSDGRSSSATSGSAGSDGPLRYRSNSWYVSNEEWTEDEIGTAAADKASRNVRLIKNLNRLSDGGEGDDVGVVVSSTSEGGFQPTTRALYAESVENVCILFTDVVGFSRISLGISPSLVMDMLQDLFGRFDKLCDVYGVGKLETVGDAYICATNLMEEEDEDDARDAAARVLSMAEDMIAEAANVRIPAAGAGRRAPFESLQIRVGIHVGSVMCGVLGRRLPKFTVCGTAVNVAARMEQTSRPGCIRVTKDFHDLVRDAESGWAEQEVISLKNMGRMETYLLDPTRRRRSIPQAPIAGQ